MVCSSRSVCGMAFWWLMFWCCMVVLVAGVVFGCICGVFGFPVVFHLLWGWYNIDLARLDFTLL